MTLLSATFDWHGKSPFSIMNEGGNGMRLIAALLLGFSCGAAADWPVVKITHQARIFGGVSVPRLQQGHLFYLAGKGPVTAWGTDGQRLFETTVTDRNGNLASSTSAAMDSNGTVAVAIGFASATGHAGGIAYLDRAGRQVATVLTGRYMPMHLCFDENRRLWAFGWQRDAENNIMEDDEPYMLVRRFSSDRKEAGSFLPRSLFAGKLNPFAGQRGLWRVQAAKDRIGGLAHPNADQHQRRWVELDLDGNLIGRWPIDPDVHGGGYAYTRSGRLFVRDAR